jgi:hypothetical protein
MAHKPIPINRKVMTLSEMDFLVLLRDAARNRVAYAAEFDRSIFYDYLVTLQEIEQDIRIMMEQWMSKGRP